jgi:glutamate synthase domain-containing protein 3
LIRELLDEHVERTGSPLGSKLLSDWETTKAKFVKVFPKEYRKVLRDRAGQSEPRPASAALH